MNKDTAKQYLPFIQALADGKTIQWLQNDGSWEDEVEPLFGFPPCHYRIKPEPLEIRVWVLDSLNEATSISISCDVGESFHGQTVKLFREVI